MTQSAKAAKALRTIKPGSIGRRSFTVQRDLIDEETRTVTLSFSSEEPVERWFGREILLHDEKSVRLDRIRQMGALLMDHDMRDQVGAIREVWIGKDNRGYCRAQFGRGVRASEVFQDVVDDIRRGVSVGYVIHSAKLRDTKDDVDTYVVDDWEPFEITLTSVPADITVGAARSRDKSWGEFEIIEGTRMSTEDEDRREDEELEEERDEDEEEREEEEEERSDEDEDRADDDDTDDEKERSMTVTVQAEKARKEGRSAEQQRSSEIIAIGEAYARFGVDKLAARAVREGWSVGKFRKAAMEKIAVPETAADIGMSAREVQHFSFIRAIAALANPTNRKAQEAAKFEREVSDAVAQKFGRSAQGMFMPSEVMRSRRDLEVGTGNGSSGGKLVATDLLASSFIDLLRNRMMTLRMGAQMLTGLVGDVAIPRQTGGATAYWVAESGAPTESAPAFDQVPLSPNTVGAYTDISRKLLLQSSIDVEMFVRNDLAKVVAQAIDAAGISGTGANDQPTGILSTGSIGAVVGGANGLAPTWAHIIELWSDLAIANADFGTTGILTNAKVIGKLMSTLKASGVPGYIVEDFPNAEGITNIGGMRGGVSNQVPSNLTKGSASGVCSAIIAGNWSDLIYGHWGALDLTVDPYSLSTTGAVRVVALQDVDVAVRHPESFSAMKDALTT
jgi:HK97 family phage major capsid protein